MKKLLLAALFALALPVFAMTAPWAGMDPNSISDTDTEAQSASSSCVDLKNNMRKRIVNSLGVVIIPASTDATTNNEVSALQDFLIDKGILHSEATGYFGALTFNAVKAYQSSLGWTPTGYVGAMTRTEIKKATCGDPLANFRARTFIYVSGTAGALAGVYKDDDNTGTAISQLVAKAKSINFANCIAVDGTRVYEGVGPCLGLKAVVDHIVGTQGTSLSSTTTGAPKVIIRDANGPKFIGLNVNNSSEIFPESKPGEIVLAYKVVYKEYSQPVSLGVAYGPVFDLSISETPGFFPTSGTMAGASQDDLRTKSFYCYKSTVDPMVLRTLVTYPVKESESMSTQGGCKLTIGKTYYINLRYPLSNTTGMSFGPGKTYAEYKFPERKFHFWSAVTGAATGSVESAGTATTVAQSTQTSGPSCGSFPAGSCVAGTPTSMTTTANSYSWGCSAGGVTTSCSMERVIETAPVISNFSAAKMHAVRPVNGKTDLIALAWKRNSGPIDHCVLTGNNGYSKKIQSTYYNLSPGNPWPWYDTDSSITNDITYSVTCYSYPSHFPSNTLTTTYRPTSTVSASAPTISSFTAVPGYENTGGSQTLTLKWASNATDCTIGAYTGFSPTPPNVMTNGVATGSTIINNPQSPTTYTLTCKNATGALSPSVTALLMHPSSGKFNIGSTNPGTLVFTLTGATRGDLEVCYEVVAHPNPGVKSTPGACDNSANFVSFDGNAEWKWSGSNLVGTFPYSASQWGASGITTKSVFRKKSAPAAKADVTISTQGTLPGSVSVASWGTISVSPASCTVPVWSTSCSVTATVAFSGTSRVSINGNLDYEFNSPGSYAVKILPTTEKLRLIDLTQPLSSTNRQMLDKNGNPAIATVQASCSTGSVWDPFGYCKAK